MGVAKLPALILALALMPGETMAGKFKCPAFTKLTSEPFVFQDPEQCDKYWTCQNGQSTRSLCPDGLVFHPEKAKGEDPCDLKANVPDKCKGRDQLQRAKPGDANCPRMYGVYASTLPWECDVYYTCQNGKSARTKCAEGLHYSDDAGICVWARDSGRDDCVTEEKEAPSKKKKDGPGSKKEPEKKPAAKLDNGFQCPGGPNGVHPALPHPTDCRLYYVCLNGLEPSDAGCPPGKVFNPKSQQCDIPANVDGCEDYYNPAAKAKKKELASSIGADLDSNDFSMFLKLLKKSGVLSGGLLQGGNSGSGIGPVLEQGGRTNRPGGRQGGRLGGRPGGRVGGRPGGGVGGRPGGRPRRPGSLGRPGRPGRPQGRLGRPGRPQRPLRVPDPSPDYYDSYEDYYEYEELDAGSQLPKSTPRQSEQLRTPSRTTPIKQQSEVVTEMASVRKPLFSVPANRKSLFSSRPRPNVRPQGEPRSIPEGPVSAVALPVRTQGPVQPARTPLGQSLSKTEADRMFEALFPGLVKTEAPVVVHPGLPEPVLLTQPASQVLPSPELHSAPRSSLFSKRQKHRPVNFAEQLHRNADTFEVKDEVIEPVKSVAVSAVVEVTTSRSRNSLFSNRRHERINPVLVSIEPEAVDPVSVRRIEEEQQQQVVTVSEPETPSHSSLFFPRNRLRSRPSLRTASKEERTERTYPPNSESSHTLLPYSPTPSPTFTEQTVSEQSFAPEEEQTTPALPFTRRKSFQNSFNSRSRSSTFKAGRQRLTKPEPEIPSSLSNVPAVHLPTPVPTEITPVPSGITITPSNPYISDTNPSPPAPRRLFSRKRPILSTRRQDTVKPAFIHKPASDRVLFVTEEEPITQERDLYNEISSPALLPTQNSVISTRTFTSDPQPQNLRRRAHREEEPITQERDLYNEISSPVLPPTLKPVISSRTFPSDPQPQNLRRRVHSRAKTVHNKESSLSARGSALQTLQSRSLSVDNDENAVIKHRIMSQAKSQLKSFLPKAENEGDALEKLRAKIASLQDTNRHRGRG